MRKNIVFISFDDAVNFWKYKRLFGAELQTPNLDKIRAVSTTFHAAYCQSPLCGPSRASFMSGRSPHQTGILDNTTRPFTILKAGDIWSYQLKQNGFFCSSGGKVHHGYVPLPPAIHNQLYSDERKMFPRDLKRRPDLKVIAAGGTGGGIFTKRPEDDAVFYDAYSSDSFDKFIRAYEGDAPFYREVGFFSPHRPFMAPVRFKRMYKFGDFQYPSAWGEELKVKSIEIDGVRKNFKTFRKIYWQKSVRNYFSAISHADYNIGRIWASLQSSRHAENTIVVIISDHGLHLGENKRFGKSTLLEQVSNVPLVIHDPNNLGPREIHDPVALIDVGPTVLDMVGLPANPTSLGKSLCPLMEGAEFWPDRAVPTFQATSGSIRKGRYRFTCDYTTGKTVFHDLVDDWWQKKPLGKEHPDYEGLSRSYFETAKMYDVKLTL